MSSPRRRGPRSPRAPGQGRQPSVRACLPGYHPGVSGESSPREGGKHLSRLVRSAARVKLSLAPRTNEFYGLFARAGANALAVAQKTQIRFREFPNSSVTQAEIRELEHTGDSITHDLSQLLTTQYGTPFDREDIYGLATAIDDVVDDIEEASDLLELYGVETMERQALAHCRILVGAAGHL